MSDPVKVYETRYAVYRHFDALRWRLFMFGVVVVLAAAFVDSLVGLTPLAGMLTLYATSVTGYALYQIRRGIGANGKTLIVSGRSAGDSDIPDVTKGKLWMAASFYGETGLPIAGGIVFLSTLF